MQVSIKKNIGEQGYADVRPGKKSVQVRFAAGGAYEVETSEWGDRAGGQYNVTMSADGNKIIGIRPVAGNYILKFVQFGNRGTVDVPEPKVQRGGPRQGKDGRRWVQPDTLVFIADVEVQSEGKYQGLHLYMNIPYIFSPVTGTNNTELKGSKTEIERCETFLRVVGFDPASNEIPYSGNVLPWLEDKLDQVGVPFLGDVDEKGWVKNPSMLPKELVAAMTKKKSKKK